MVQIKWLVSSKSDLKEIYEFIANDSRRYAKLQIQRIIYKIINENEVHILYVHHSSRDLLLRNF